MFVRRMPAARGNTFIEVKVEHLDSPCQLGQGLCVWAIFEATPEVSPLASLTIVVDESPPQLLACPLAPVHNRVWGQEDDYLHSPLPPLRRDPGL
jgi:hypothetical protein